MTGDLDDVLELFDHVGRRLLERMAGLGNDEWAWCAVDDDRIGLRWRLRHIAETLVETRNAVWLGLPAVSVDLADDEDAERAVGAVRVGLEHWRALLTDDRLDLKQPIGPVAGPYGTATRQSFVLHIADELIHHGAEAALLRDLYAAGSRS